MDADRPLNRIGIGLALLLLPAAAGCCAHTRCEPVDQGLSGAASGEPIDLFRRGEGTVAQAGSAALPRPFDGRADMLTALERGAMLADGRVVQAQPVAWEGPDGNARRMILRWLCDGAPERLNLDLACLTPESGGAGWSFDYRWIEGVKEGRPWIPLLRNVPLDKVEYEMYQLDLEHEEAGRLGVRLGLRHNNRIYWWQFIRADFVQRGSVFDLLRCGGPIYNEESTIQGDLYLVLYANGLIEAYAHFINNQREGIGTETHGVPVIAFEVPGRPDVNVVLDGSTGLLDMGAWQLNLGQSAGYADEARPGSFKTEGDVVVLQPWLDQEIYGELLVEREGIREDQIVPGNSRAGEDGYWVAKLGDHTIPRGMARTVRFTMSPAGAPPEVARYQAPAWWFARCHALPTAGRLPTLWWAVPRALEAGEEYFEPHPRHGPFELGCTGRDQDGTLGAAMLMLGNATEHPRHCEHALLPVYWWADIAIDHVDFTVHELPKYSWQWVVQPYQRWTELVYAYWETGDPYLLETARFAADAYYRFFWTNRPHRTVGRDALPCSGLLALYECTGEDMYLQRVRGILAEARRSYAQPDDYMPGHQSGCGPNGVGRQPSYGYISLVLAQLHTQVLNAAQGTLPSDEEDAAWAFIRDMLNLFDEKGRDDGWAMRAVALSYLPIPALADHCPDEADAWIDRLIEWNALEEMPGAHDGGKPYSWVAAALRFDSWAWGATWEDGMLHLRPHVRLLEDPRAPKTATILTPKGRVTVTRHEDGTITAEGGPFVVQGKD